MEDPTLTEQQLAELRQLLVDKRHALQAHVVRAAQAMGTPAGPQAEYMDGAEQAIEEDSRARRADREGGLLAEIDHALAKFDDDRYGISEESDEPIPYERLRAVPWARRTVEEEERRDRR